MSGTDYAVWINSDGTLQYWDGTSSTNTNIQIGLSATYESSFLAYNLPAGAVLYGANATNGIYKIDTSFSYSSVSAEPAQCLCYSGRSGRMFFANGQKIYFSAIQDQTATTTTNLESYNTTDDWILPSADDGTTVTEITDDGRVLWIWKDSGIWGILNVYEAPEDWYVPKAFSDVGTISKKTIQYVKYNNVPGYIFLATDKTLRFFAGQIDGNSGTVPVLKDTGSIVISNAFASIIKDIPDAYLSQCSGGYVDSKYILNFVSPAGSELDTAIILDLEKLDQNGSPFWCYATDIHNTHYIINKNKSVFGVHRDGWISSMLSNDVYQHERPERSNQIFDDDIVDSDAETRSIAIPWSFYTYYIQLSPSLVRLHDAIVFWKTGGYWSIEMIVNMIKDPDILNEPKDYDGLVITLDSVNSGNSYYDISHFDVDTYSGSANYSFQNSGAQGYGNYCAIGFRNEIRGEWATVFQVKTKLQSIRSDAMTNNL